MRRRDFMAAVGTAMGAWPLAALAQQATRMMRVGALMALPENDPLYHQSLSINFIETLARRGWGVGRNIRIDQRWSTDASQIDGFAQELLDLSPDAVLSAGTPATRALQRRTRTLPIVFTLVSDPVGSGFVAGLPRPGGNITGFLHVEGTIAGKWVQMIKEIAPGIRQIAAMYNPEYVTYAKYFLDPFEASARSLGLEPIVAPVHNDSEIEAAIRALGRNQGGLVGLPDGFLNAHRSTLISAGLLYKVPTTSIDDIYTREGGLLSYQPHTADEFRGAAAYVDRILKGEKPADLPVQAPVKHDLSINLKTAKALGLTVPPALLVFADEIIE
jgi:putative tryptophan/tyrosine transport system substrate-binding protein